MSSDSPSTTGPRTILHKPNSQGSDSSGEPTRRRADTRPGAETAARADAAPPIQFREDVHHMRKPDAKRVGPIRRDQLEPAGRRARHRGDQSRRTVRLHLHKRQASDPPLAIDPDEDTITFSIKWNFGDGPKIKIGPDEASFLESAGKPVELTVTASDGKLSDWQTINFRVHYEPPLTP